MRFLAVFLLPWQARWIYGQHLLSGQAYEYGALSLYASSLVLVAALVSIIVIERRRPSVSSMFFLVFVWLLAGFFWASDRTLAASAIGTFALATGYFFLAQVSSREQIMKSFIAGGLVHVAIVWQQMLARYIPANTWLGVARHDPAELGQAVVMVNGERLLRAYGLLSHPNILGLFLFVASALLLYHFIVYERHYRLPKVMVPTWLYLAGQALIMSALWLSFSRAALIVTAVFLIWWLVYGVVWRKKKLTRAVSLTVLVGIATFLAVNILYPGTWAARLGPRSDIQAEAQRLEQIAISDRLSGYRQAYYLLDASTVFFGVGAGQYVPRLANAFPGLASYEYQPAHNIYLLAIIELGLVGGVLIFWFLAVTIIKAWRLSRRLFVFQFSLSLFLAVAASGLADHFLWTSYFGLSLIWLLLGLAVKPAPYTTHEQ